MERLPLQRQAGLLARLTAEIYGREQVRVTVNAGIRVEALILSAVVVAALC